MYLQYRRLLLFALAGVVFSSALTFAKSIPGVTRPYDPGKYYSAAEISYRDSTYTPFTMMDLARNGYAVRDVENNKKDSISDIKTYLEMANQITAVWQAISEMAPMESKLEAVSLALDKLKSAEPFEMKEDAFTSTERLAAKEREKYGSVAAAYATAVKGIEDHDRQGIAVTKAIKEAQMAEGFVAATQAKAQMQAVEAAYQMEQNTLWARYLSVAAAHEKALIDRQLTDWKQTRDGMAFQVADPYRPTEQEKKQYKRKEGVGFIDF